MPLCSRCRFSSDIPFQACPSCGEPVVILDPEPVDPNAPIRLADVLADPIEACKTNTPFDAISGHGVPFGASILLYGPAGIGKSSWALILGTRWPRIAGRAWYLPYERGPEMLRRDADRLNLDPRYLWVVGSGATPFSFMARKGLIIIDSLNHFASIFDMTMIEAMRAITEHANETGTTILSIGHVTKEWDLAGSERVKHEADVLVSITPMSGHSPKKKPLQDIACTEKNRFGALWRRLEVYPWDFLKASAQRS